VFQFQHVFATEFSNHTFLIAEGNSVSLNSNRFWKFLKTNDNVGIEIKISEADKRITISSTNQDIIEFLSQIQKITESVESKIVPLFLTFNGDISILDSIISSSKLASKFFFLPQGETWPSLEYLIQSNRKIILFVKGNYINESRILHRLDNYVLKISANKIMGTSDIFEIESAVNNELFLIDEFDKLPTNWSGTMSRHQIPDYINYALENWTKYGKRPNFIFAGNKYSQFYFIISQLNSFPWISGSVKVLGKTLERVYWKNQEISVTGGKFSFPYRGGEELMLSAFAPGYKMSPKQIVITGEMEVSENYPIIATPIGMGEDITGSFHFDNLILNEVNPKVIFDGENYSFSEDIERGNVIKLPENASINLGNPEQFGLRNSSFTVSCFVKFTEILEFGDNAILGNYENEYRRGLHLVLRSGHPYFGLWGNDYISEEKLQANIWYHLVWRYIIETGEQAIFLNGKNIGSSQGHPPFSGTGDILLGSALSEGASLRGYADDLYFWSRPLGKEEINRLALNEEIQLFVSKKNGSVFKGNSSLVIIGFIVLILLFIVLIVLFQKIRNPKKQISINLPKADSSNQIKLFNEFTAINNKRQNITNLFTPKVKELFLFVLIYTVKNGNGARITDINEQLWPGIESKKIANNRAVTLNKLRKILNEIDGIEIVIQNRYFVIKMSDPFFSDYVEAIHLCQIAGGMTRLQLETFFVLVKKGSLLKETNWNWLDDIRGYTGNQVIDNLLNLASIYKKENNLESIDSISKRILDYDDLNEEAIYLQIWMLQKTNNSHLAKFNFKSFCTKYEENLGEPFSMDFEQFIQHYSNEF
jgi:two-component SAPR family response regulator